MGAIFSAALAAKVAAAGDKTTYCQHIVSDLGPSRTVELKTFSAAPSDWQTGWGGLGTTFYAAPLSGNMEINNGVITKFGDIALPTVEANAILSVGFAAMRISGSGAWSQFTLGLPGGTGYDGLPVSIVLRKNPNGTYGIVLNSVRFAAPASLPLSPVAELHRRTLTNESAGVQSSGFVTQTFGEFFEQGEVPAGTYPQWRTVAGDLLCHSTVYNHVRWPDGSLRWCGVMLAVPQSVPAGGTIEIAVKSGGDVPALSSRSLADAAGLNLNVLVTGVTGLTGDWTVALNTGAATPANVVKLADGAAGAIFRVQEDFQQAGAPHGQLICWHYVEVLQNAAGAHAGTRYAGRVALPWADVTSPAPVGMAVTCALRSGATVQRQLQGKNASNVLGSTILLPHYGSFFTCDVTALYDFFPGAQSSECVVRVKPAGKKAARVRLAPAYDFDLVPTNANLRNYEGHGNGSMVYATGTTGPRSEISVFPTWAVKYVIGDVPNAEREVRVNAMVTSGWVDGLRRSTTGEVIPTNQGSTTYAGLGANQPTWRIGSVGFSVPTSQVRLWSGEENSHHRGGATYPAYLFTAEPQYIDLLVEQAVNLIGTMPQGNAVIAPVALPITTALDGAEHSRETQINGTTYPAGGFLFRHDLLRYAAWGMRDLAQAASIYPDTCPRGTEVKKYMRDMIDSVFLAFKTYRNLMPAEYRSNGIMGLKRNYGTNEVNEHPWCMGYLATSWSLAAGMLQSANAFECAQHLANFYSSFKAQSIDFAGVYTLDINAWGPDGARLHTVTSMASAIADVSVTFTAATNTVTFKARNYGFANGDQYMVPANGIFQGKAINSLVYVVNKSGQSFQVSDTPGGAPLTILQDGTSYAPRMRVASFAPGVSFEYTDSNSYLANITGAMRYLKAIGCTGLDAAVADGDARLVAVGTDLQLAHNPQTAFAVAYPTGD